MNLLALQRRMSEDVCRPLTADFAMQQEPEDGRSMDGLAATYIKPNALLSSFERLEIYNRQYWFRVIGAVSEDFPALAASLGQKRFDTLVLAYLRENPSTSFSLRNLGANLPVWFEAHPEFSTARHALMVDIARLEWAYVESFDRGAVPPLTETDFAGLNGESRLSLQPHLQLLDLRYPVDDLVLAVHKATPESDIMSNAVTERKAATRLRLPAMRRAKVYLAVHRFDFQIYYRRIDGESYRMLAALQQRKTLGEAIGTAFAGSKLNPEDQAAKIQGCFAHAAELGWFCRQPPDYIGIQ